jgi:hypothetical protein
MGHHDEWKSLEASGGNRFNSRSARPGGANFGKRHEQDFAPHRSSLSSRHRCQRIRNGELGEAVIKRWRRN